METWGLFPALCKIALDLVFLTGETGDPGPDLHFPLPCQGAAAARNPCKGFEEHPELTEG